MPAPESKKPKLSHPSESSKATTNTKKSKMKVTLLSGFLGAGKTTLLKRILRLNNALPEEERLRMAVIVNDMGEINLDADEIKSSKVVQEDAEMVEMHNGCICCTLRGDLLKTVKSLSEEGKYDYLVIESTGIGEPLPVAQTFTMDVDELEAAQHHHHDEHHHHEESTSSTPGLTVARDEKNSLSHYATLDTLVTVIDALNIFDVLGSIDTLASKNNVAGMNGLTGALEAGPKTKADPSDSDGHETETTEDESTDEEEKNDEEEVDDRSIAQLLLDQIEFADVIVVSKAKLLLEQQKAQASPEDGLKEIERLLHRLNPGAKIVVPKQDKYGDLDVSKELINTGLFDMEKASQSAGWLQELSKPEHTPETEEYGISSLLFKAKHMPFHPERLHKILNGFGSYGMAVKGGSLDEEDDKTERNGAFQGVVRAKGQFWLANANAYPCEFQTAGKNVQVHPNEEQPFLAAMPRDTWDEGEKELCQELQKHNDWDERFGDRRSLLVFIGIGMDKARIRQQLTEALLTEDEHQVLGGMGGWDQLEDPFFNGQCKYFHEIESS